MPTPTDMSLSLSPDDLDGHLKDTATGEEEPARHAAEEAALGTVFFSLVGLLVRPGSVVLG